MGMVQRSTMNRAPYRWPNVRLAPKVEDEVAVVAVVEPATSAGRTNHSSRASISDRPTRLDVSGTSVQR